MFFDSSYSYHSATKYNVDTAQTHGKTILGEHSLNGKVIWDINGETNVTCSQPFRNGEVELKPEASSAAPYIIAFSVQSHHPPEWAAL